MSEKMRIGLAGICGYGRHYLDRLMDEAEAHDAELVVAIARRPERSTRFEELKERGIRICRSPEEFYKDDTVDMMMLSSPIHLHRPFTCLALERGSHVFCEKPAAGAIQDSKVMAAAEAAAGKQVGIGFQWSWSDTIQALKKDIMAGDFGRPLRLRALIFWGRNEGYFTRNTWVGRFREDDGSWVLDSPLNNATAHFVHNMFYLLGSSREASAEPADVQAELYRANPIQNFDTAAMRSHTTDGAELLFYTTHATAVDEGPMLCYEFENAAVYYELQGGDSFIVRFRDGTMRNYGNPYHGEWDKIWKAVAAVRGGESMPCGIGATMSQTICVNGAQESMPDIVEFPKSLVSVETVDGAKFTTVKGLESILIQCFHQGILPSEHGALNWAKAGKVIDLRGYESFPSTVSEESFPRQ